MRVCVPVQEDAGLESVAGSHFGSAGMFLVCDPETGVLERIDNADAGHEHGSCNPVGAVAGLRVDAVLTGGIGSRAVTALNASGIRVFRAVPGTLSENLQLLRTGGLEEISAQGACGGHGHTCG